jgi:hypothetical protein
VVDEITGEPALEELLAERGNNLSAERLCRLFAFPLDNFQKKVSWPTTDISHLMPHASGCAGECMRIVLFKMMIDLT